MRAGVNINLHGFLDFARAENENPTGPDIQIVLGRPLDIASQNPVYVEFWGSLQAELQSVGVDIKKFQAHIIRSSSMKLAIGGGKPEDQVLRTAQVSQKVFSDFYNLPLVDATSEPENMLGAAAADCLMDASVPELTGTNAQTNMGEAERENTSAEDYSSITSLGAINDS
eukprot:COSAG05_NODE_43_length_25931_cov_49.314636_18_plen_170_part_00